jgi:type IV pilus assembly protein PilO
VNIDFSQFDDLDLNNIAHWPLFVKTVVASFVAVLVLGLGYIALISEKISLLERIEKEEITLKQQYRVKYHVAANLELFQQQMIEAQAMFSKQLKNLPESHETPGLLDDITFVGTSSGLDFVKLNWQPEVEQEIYIELPIDMKVIGNYHEFGNFVSEIAGLPRIVTLHNFTIEIEGQWEQQLNLTLQAKTYRYKEATAE